MISPLQQPPVATIDQHLTPFHQTADMVLEVISIITPILGDSFRPKQYDRDISIGGTSAPAVQGTQDLKEPTIGGP